MVDCEVSNSSIDWIQFSWRKIHDSYLPAFAPYASQSRIYSLKTNGVPGAISLKKYEPYFCKYLDLICKVTCLITCLLLYWLKIHRIFVNFSFFWHWVSFFLFSTIKISNVIYNKKCKKDEATVSATYGGPLQCHKLKD